MALSPTEFWMEGGLFMYPVLMIGGMGVFAACASLLLKEKVAPRAAMLLLLVAGMIGAGGTTYNRYRVESVIAAVSPEYKDRILEQGYLESMRPVQLAGGLIALGLPLALIGMFLGTRRNSA